MFTFIVCLYYKESVIKVTEDEDEFKLITLVDFFFFFKNAAYAVQYVIYHVTVEVYKLNEFRFVCFPIVPLVGSVQ